MGSTDCSALSDRWVRRMGRTGVRRRVVACLLALAAAFTVLGGAPPAQAAGNMFLSPTPSTGWHIDGIAYATLIVGDTVYVGGTFSNAVGPDGSRVPRKNLAAFNLTTGELVTSFRPTAGNTVRSFATDGTSLYVGGNFRMFAGATRTYLAKVNLVTGALDASFAPVLDNVVRAIAHLGGALYVGGNFTQVNATVRNRLAKIDPTTGVVDGAFSAHADNSVYALEASPSGDRLYAGGNFSAVNGVIRNGIAAVVPATGAVTGPAFTSAARPTFALAINEDGSSLFGAGGSATNATAAWATSSGTRKWRVVTDGDNQAVTYFRGEVYFGFHDGYQANTALKLLAADATTGAVDPTFRPVIDKFWGMWALDISERGLAAAGDFTSVGGVSTTGFARFLPASAPPPPPPSVEVLLGPESQWGYWDQGTRPAGWETPAFDSSSWPRGLPRLGYGDTFVDTVVGFGPSSTNKFITTYFRSSFQLTDIPDRLQVQVSADDGAAVYVNGTEVVRDNLPAGVLGNTSTALTERSGGAETALAAYSVDSSLLTTGTNVVAIEVHQFSKSSSDMGLDVQVDGISDGDATTSP